MRKDFSLLVAAVAVIATSAHAKWPPIVSGEWQGQCIRAGKPSANVTLVLDNPTFTFGTGPIFNADLSGRRLKFEVKGDGGTVTRTFVGEFSPDWTQLTGSYSQPDGKAAQCALNYTG